MREVTPIIYPPPGMFDNYAAQDDGTGIDRHEPVGVEHTLKQGRNIDTHEKQRSENRCPCNFSINQIAQESQKYKYH